jgi:hypothetical protein
MISSKLRGWWGTARPELVWSQRTRLALVFAGINALYAYAVYVRCQGIPFWMDEALAALTARQDSLGGGASCHVAQCGVFAPQL